MIHIDVNPVAFSLGPIEVRWYGIMIALAVMTLVLWTLREVRKGAKISPDTVFTAALVGIPSGVIFSRLLHVLDNWSYYSQNPGQIIGGGGLAAYGAILGAALGIFVYSRLAHFKFGYFADVLAPGIILAQAVGRVGCTLNGCCYGTQANIPWAIVYTNPNSLGFTGAAVHPTQVYEIIWNLIAFGILLRLKGKLKPDGSLFLVYLSLYAFYRLVSDFWRDGTPFLIGLHEAQVISLVVLAITLPLLIIKTRWVRPGPTVGESAAAV